LGFWFWFLIWAILVLAALGVFAVLGWQLANKALRAGRQAMQLADQLQQLAMALDSKETYSKPDSAVLADPTEVFAQRAVLVRNKAAKAEARQRRLIKSLANINVDESRFTHG
jgi:hypothetical protein